MTRSRFWPMLVAPALLLTLAACGGSDDKSVDLPTMTPQPTKSVSSTPAPSTPATLTPTASANPVTKYRDLTLQLVPPRSLDIKARTAFERLQRFQGLFASMVAGAPTPAEFSLLASPQTVKRFNDLMKAQRQAKERGAGQLTIRTTKVTVGKALIAVEGCFDQTKLVTIRPDGSRYVDPTVTADPTMAMQAVLTNTTGPWRVDSYTLTDGKC